MGFVSALRTVQTFLTHPTQMALCLLTAAHVWAQTVESPEALMRQAVGQLQVGGTVERLAESAGTAVAEPTGE